MANFVRPLFDVNQNHLGGSVCESNNSILTAGENPAIIKQMNSEKNVCREEETE